MDRPSVSHRPVFIGLAASLVVAIAFALFVYYKFIRYEPRAEAYLPQGAQVTVWIHMEQAVVYEPFRREFFPLLEAGRQGPESRLLHLERKTTLELGVDTRELAFAFLPNDAWVLVLGGLYRPDRVAEGVVALLREEGRQAELVRSGLAQVGPRAYLGSETPGLLLVGSEPDLVSGPPRAPKHSADSDALRLQVFARPLEARSGPQVPDLSLRVRLAADFPFEVTLKAEWGPAEALEARLREVWSEERPHLSAAAEGARLMSSGRFSVFEGTLERQGFDELLAELSREVRRRAHPAFDP
jgi:hypothetical protein